MVKHILRGRLGSFPLEQNKKACLHDNSTSAWCVRMISMLGCVKLQQPETTTTLIAIKTSKLTEENRSGPVSLIKIAQCSRVMCISWDSYSWGLKLFCIFQSDVAVIKISVSRWCITGRFRCYKDIKWNGKIITKTGIYIIHKPLSYVPVYEFTVCNSYCIYVFFIMPFWQMSVLLVPSLDL